MVRADERLKQSFPHITLPLLILHGTADKATKPGGSQLFYDTAGSKDKTLKLYDGHFHDLLNDSARRPSWPTSRAGSTRGCRTDSAIRWCCRHHRLIESPASGLVSCVRGEHCEPLERLTGVGFRRVGAVIAIALWAISARGTDREGGQRGDTARCRP